MLSVLIVGGSKLLIYCFFQVCKCTGLLWDQPEFKESGRQHVLELFHTVHHRVSQSAGVLVYDEEVSE